MHENLLTQATLPIHFATPVANEGTNVIDTFEHFVVAKRFLDPEAFQNFLHEFREEVQRLEKVLSREEIIKKLGEIRAVCAESPFVERVQKWPKGYQGDFETIDYIMKAINQAKEGTFGYQYENYFLNSAICQQHKNKIAHQTNLIKKALLLKNDAKIISIGCGTSEDVRQCIPEIKISKAKVTLIDVDQNAIDFSLVQLNEIKGSITYLTGNIYRLMRTLTETYDLILIGGVFDYLNDKTIISVLASLRCNLTTNGKLFFTNIDVGNPYRIFMEYTGNWILTERSQDHLYELIKNAGWPESSVKLKKEETGLTHLVELIC